MCDDKINTTSSIIKINKLGHNSDILASSFIGCYIENVAGIASRIASGEFTSVVVHQNQVYAADGKKTKTQVFQHNHTSSRWTKIRSIDHDFKKKYMASADYNLTLSISNNQLKYCSAESDSIKVYSLSGKLLKTYGSRGFGNAGNFGCAYISDDDDDGSVLIVDQRNDDLQVMSEQGEFSFLQLEPPVSARRRAVLFSNQLYMTIAKFYGAQGSIRKHTC